MGEHGPIEWLWIGLATVTGAVTSLIFRPYKQMTWSEILVSLLVSCSFAAFVGSAVAEWVATKLFGHVGEMNVRAYGAVMWGMAAVSFVVIPVLLSRASAWASAWSGNKEPTK